MADRDAPRGENRIDALNDIVDLVKVEVLSHVSGGNSPVAGRPKFKRLTKEYAKREKGGDRNPNLELTGEMLGALNVKRKGNRIEVSISGKQGDKAEGHNQIKEGSKLPVRRFIPAAREIFKQQIVNDMKRIIDDFSEENDQ